jgi:K+-sensing histidine kinase KdpD
MTPARRLLLDTFAEHAVPGASSGRRSPRNAAACNQEADIERLRSTLLASVSHDLRTPLTPRSPAPPAASLDDGSHDPDAPHAGPTR